ncbi:MAG TPA: phage tail tube protein [Methanothrix sp.]|nr:phage tail tube protein [Methanothrix sp.]HPC90314.1 phage tail tube protein [Methanothrix sp.]HQE86935.1 phage tail tube protein [Methanothrix sp.]
MTNANSGMSGSLWVCATSNGTFVKLAEVSDAKIKIDGKEIDTSNVDDSGWGSSIMGAGSWEVTVTNNLILTDSAYGIIKTALLGRSVMYVKILQSGTPLSSPKGFSGACYVMSGSYTLAGTNTQQKVDFTLKGSGALSELP